MSFMCGSSKYCRIYDWGENGSLVSLTIISGIVLFNFQSCKG